MHFVLLKTICNNSKHRKGGYLKSELPLFAMQYEMGYFSHHLQNGLIYTVAVWKQFNWSLEAIQIRRQDSFQRRKACIIDKGDMIP